MTGIVKSISIENMLNQRNAIIAQVAEARSALFKAAQICDAQNLQLCHMIESRHNYSSTELLRADTERDKFMPQFTQRLDAQLWGRLMHESGLRTFMDGKARDEWDKAIQEYKTPPLTIENIEATFERLHGSRLDMFERGVIEVFKGLSWNYKSNLPQKFGKRIVVEYFMDSWGHVSSYSRSDKLADLERCMYMLDGKPAPDHRTGIVQACGTAWRDTKKREAQDDYFRVKWFKNQNGHFYFKRADLVDKMNKIIAKHYPDALPPVKDASHA